MIVTTDSSNVTISENVALTMTCQAEARPTATLTLTKEGSGQVNSSQSPLSHVVRASCLDTGHYTCSARNELGSAGSTVTKTVVVNCKSVEWCTYFMVRGCFF
jgi:hypothetical protein